jgi:hypothetical protein
MPEPEEPGKSTPSFQESAKKFKRGPVAPPEREDDRPDMSGATRAEFRPDHEQLAAAMHLAVGGAPSEADMSEGEPGTLTMMPGEEEKSGGPPG